MFPLCFTNLCLIHMKLFLNTGTIYLMDGLQPQQEVDWCQTSSHPAAKLSLEKKMAGLTRLRDSGDVFTSVND